MNIVWFLVCSLVWGSTWIAITFQLGVVDPMVSVFFRFFLAAMLLLGFCLVTRRKLAFSARDHFWFLLNGAFMFCVNYYLVYLAEEVLTSGLVAISYTTIIFLNAVNSRIFLGAPILPRIIFGGVIGVVGLTLIFVPELSSFSADKHSLMALGYCLLGAVSVSFGNTSAQVCHRRKVPVVQMALFGMVYGSLLMGTTAWFRGVPFTVDLSMGYIGSLLYLSVFGSIVAFLGYLTLLRNIGSDRTAYIALVTPLVALSISTVVEGYTWSGAAAVGVLFILAGNVVALRPKKRR